MLYDNALLSRLYLHYFQLTKDGSARRVAEGILDYVAREMTDPTGGFYSTQDADSEGVEGKFFVWTPRELKEVLGNEDAEIFASHYDVTESGNFEGKNILNVKRSGSEIAAEQNVTLETISESLERSRRNLYDIREARVKPGRDEKILTAWNGMMLASFAEAGAILDRDDYRQIARNNARFLLQNLRRDALVLRTYKDGKAKLNGYLEDYAFLGEGLLTLFETTGELEWFEAAVELTDKMIEEFWDNEEGGFFFTGKSHEALIVRSKDYFDNATPSGNSVAAELLLRLATLTENDDYKRRALTVLRLVSDLLRRYPTAFGRALCALDYYLGTPKEIAVIGDVRADATRTLLNEVWNVYLPNKVVATTAPDNNSALSLIPILRNRGLVNHRPTAYVCENYTCQSPVTDPENLASQLLGKATASG